MRSSISIQTLVSQTWYATYANPRLLVFGLTIGILALFTESLLSPYSELLSDYLKKDALHEISPLFLLLILFTLLCSTFFSSQIFILAASNSLHRQKLLLSRARILGSFIYVGVELLYVIMMILAASLLFLLPLHNGGETNFLVMLASNFSFALFLIGIFAATIIKRLLLGYLILSPLHFRSSLQLSIKLFLRYRYFSILSLCIFLSFSILFTILENLVMLQSAFIPRYLLGIHSEVFTYSVLLLANTFMAIFLEVFWLNFFLALTNKKQKSAVPLPLAQDTLEDMPLIPS